MFFLADFLNGIDTTAPHFTTLLHSLILPTYFVDRVLGNSLNRTLLPPVGFLAQMTGWGLLGIPFGLWRARVYS
jgi:hypothetical protein